MIPLRLEVTNLGAIPHAIIDFRNITLAAICGKNGAGKSTMFTIAPLFALFGTTKNKCSVDDMIRTGQEELSVTFDFEHHDEVYRVIRTRSNKGKGKSTLELQKAKRTVFEDGSMDWDPISGTTIRETEDKIKELLNLDEDTFTASSMILQGKANEFTSKPAGQRKAILAQILGLDIYEKLQEKAREKARALDMELEKAKKQKSDLETKLNAKPALENDLSSVRDEMLRISNLIKEKELELQHQEDLLRQMMAKADKVTELNEKICAINQEIGELETEKSTHLSKIERANKMLELEAEIVAKAKEYLQVKENIAVLKTKQPRQNELKLEKRNLDKELVNIEGKRSRLHDQMVSIERQLSRRKELEEASVRYWETLKVLEEKETLERKWTDLSFKVREVKNKVEQAELRFKNKVKELETEISYLSTKTEMLNNSNCLDPEKASCRFLKDAQEAKERLIIVQNELQNLDNTEVNNLNSEWMKLDINLKELAYDPEEHKRVKDLTNELRPKADQAAELNSKVELLENLKEQKQSLDEQHEQLKIRFGSLDQQINELTEELKPLTEMEIRLPKLEQWAKAKEELPAAKEILNASNERIMEIERALLAKKEHHQHLEQEKNQIIKEIVDTVDTGSIKEKIGNLKIFIKELQSEEKNLYSKEGNINALLNNLKESELQLNKLLEDIGPLSKKLVRYQALIKAFGRDGIPALIIENAVPELERISNEILSEMTNGEHSLRFETQKDLKSRDGVAETLDIIIGDWAGERPYETFSGGEQLRIDFAIRFALAELLARRAGSKIEWLVVDEGLGSQDSEHRTLVLESIKSVADRFRIVLVITHIEEAQAVFEQRIYFEPRTGGIELNVA